MVIVRTFWTPLLLLLLLLLGGGGGGGGGGKGVSLVVGALVSSSAAESVSSLSSSATTSLDSGGMGGDGDAAEIVADNPIEQRIETQEPTVEEQRWLEQQRQDNITTTTNNSTIYNDTSSIFEGIVVVVIESSFNNATPEEIIQFQNDFRDSYNLVNGVVLGMISDENVTDNNTTTNNNNNQTTTNGDPFRREIINVTLEYNFTFTPGLSNVPMNEVRRHLLVRKEQQQEGGFQQLLFHHRDLQEVDDSTTTTTMSGNTSDTNTSTTTTFTTIEIPTQRYIQIVLYCSAICTRCPSDVALFDDVSNSGTTIGRRQLQTINNENEENEEEEDDDDENSTTTTTPGTKQQGPILEGVLSVFQSKTTYDIPELVEVEDNICPDGPLNMYFTEIDLELTITTSEYDAVVTSQDGQDLLAYFVQFIFNDLSQKKFCDPLYRTIMNVQIDDIFLVDNDDDNNDDDDGEITVVGIIFLVEVYCSGLDCEQYGQDLFDNDNLASRRQRQRRQRSSSVVHQEATLLASTSSSSSSSSSLTAAAGYPSPPSRRLRAKEGIPSWITKTSKVPHPSTSTSSTTTTTTTTTTKRQSFQQEEPPMKSIHRRTLMDDPSSSSSSSSPEEKCYCPANAIGNRAPTRSEFLKVYQLAIDSAIDATPAPTNVPTTVPPTYTPTTTPTTNQPTLGPTNVPTTVPPTSAPTTTPTTNQPTLGSTDAISLTLVSVSDGYVNLDYSFNPNTELGAWIGFWPVGTDPRKLPSPSSYWVSICNENQNEDCSKSGHPTSGSVSIGYEFINSDDPEPGDEFEAFLIESKEWFSYYDSIAQSESFIF